MLVLRNKKFFISLDAPPLTLATILIGCLATQLAKVGVGMRLPKNVVLDGVGDALDKAEKHFGSEAAELLECSSVDEVEKVLKNKLGVDKLPTQLQNKIDKLRAEEEGGSPAKSEDNVWSGPRTVH